MASALALATHYFAIFPIALEGFLLLRRRGREAAAGVGILSRPASRWRRSRSTRRCRATPTGSATTASATGSGRSAVTFAVGETGDVIAQPERLAPAIVPLAAIAAALLLLALRGERVERRAAGLMLAIAGFTVAAPLAIAVVRPSADFVLARNLIPALVPLLVAVAIGAHPRPRPPRRDRRRRGAVRLLAGVHRPRRLGAVASAGRLGRGRQRSANRGRRGRW